jgi:hypothetical protein
MYIPDFVIPDSIKCVSFTVPITQGVAGISHTPFVLSNKYFYIFSINGGYYGNTNFHVLRTDLIFQIRFSSLLNTSNLYPVNNNGSYINVNQSILCKADWTLYELGFIINGFTVWGSANANIQPTFTYTSPDTSGSITGSYMFGEIKKSKYELRFKK